MKRFSRRARPERLDAAGGPRRASSPPGPVTHGASARRAMLEARKLTTVTRSTASRSIVLALALGALAGGAAASAPAATPLVRVRPAHLPLSLGLPSGWRVTTLAPGTRFDAQAPGDSARLAVTTGLYPGSFRAFAAAETAAARAYYRSQDPKASLRAHTITLRSGPALEIDVSLQHGSPIAISLFSVLHDMVSYHFTYSTSQSEAASDEPSFESSARSIAFTT
jgi:hypothetical protein